MPDDDVVRFPKEKEIAEFERHAGGKGCSVRRYVHRCNAAAVIVRLMFASSFCVAKLCITITTW